MTYLEQATTAFGGIALRYGAFYGAANDALIHPFGNGSTRSSVTAAGSSPGCTSTTAPQRQC